MAAPERVRLSLDVTADVNATLERLAEETGNTKSDILRKAIGLMMVAADAKKKGETLGVVGEDGKLHVRLVGL